MVKIGPSQKRKKALTGVQIPVGAFLEITIKFLNKRKLPICVTSVNSKVSHGGLI